MHKIYCGIKGFMVLFKQAKEAQKAICFDI